MNTAQQFGIVLVAVLGFFLYIQLLCALIAWWSGWRELAARFRHDYDFRDQIGGWQSARMRRGCHYNNAIKIAANAEGLHLTTIAIVPQHPPLLIPWNEIKLVRRSTMWMWTFAHLQLGAVEQIPFVIQEKLFDRINSQGQIDAANLW